MMFQTNILVHTFKVLHYPIPKTPVCSYIQRSCFKTQTVKQCQLKASLQLLMTTQIGYVYIMINFANFPYPL